MCMLCHARTFRHLISPKIILKIHRNRFASQASSNRTRKWISAASGSEGTTAAAATPFTVMSYNILSQTHLQTHKTLYADHDVTALNWPHRLSRISREITDIAPDILCLQEVERDHLSEIGDKLSALHFNEALYKKRTGNQIDGCAIFFNSHKFQLMESHSVDYFQPGVHVSRLFFPRRRRAVDLILTMLLLLLSDIESLQCGHCGPICAPIESKHSIRGGHNAFAIQSETHRHPLGAGSSFARRIGSHRSQWPRLSTDYSERRFQFATGLGSIPVDHRQERSHRQNIVAAENIPRRRQCQVVASTATKWVGHFGQLSTLRCHRAQATTSHCSKPFNHRWHSTIF